MQRCIIRRSLIGLISLGAALAFLPRNANAQSTAIPSTAAYACDFENNWCDFAEQSALGDVPSGTARRSSIVSPGRSGSYAVRLHTEAGDTNVHGSGTWDRDDLTLGPSPSYCNEGQEEWWAVSVMFPSDYVYPPGPEGGVVLDFHHNADNGLPNMSIDTMPGTGMRQRGYGGPTVNGGQYTAQIADPYGAVGDVTRNQWYDFVFHMKWSSNSDGYMEAWLNGKKFQMYNGATLYSGISCYLKLANYHADFGLPSSIVFDRVIRGTSADVAIEPLEGVSGGVSTFSQPSSSTPYNNPPSPGTATTTVTTTSGTSGSTGTTGTSGSGSTSPSATMDSSSFTIATGQSVTFTAKILGNATTPTGTVMFDSDGAPISGCNAVALSAGTATCTTSSLAGGATHAITGVYSGDSTYGAAQAGPISETVSGTATTSTTSSGSAGSSGTGTATSGSGSGSLSATIESSSYSASAGQSVTFTAALTGGSGTPTGKITFQDNGSAIAACTNVAVSAGQAVCTLSTLAGGTHAISGLYSGDSTYAAALAGPITQTVTAGSSTTTAATGGDLSNLSTRMQVLTGSNVMIGGFVIGGTSNKTVVVRARGPSLTQYGIANALANPTLQLVRSSDQSVVATNTGWTTAANASQISASGFAPSDPAESAILVSLPPGAYTATMQGVNGATGVGMVEVFEVDNPQVPLINISTRGQVLSGNDVMIGGFVIAGTTPQTVVVRARGPSLSQYGIANALSNPRLQLVRSSDQSVVATNDDWQQASNAPQISASGLAPSDPLESAVMVTLNPGAYTAIVTGTGGATGVGMVEVFTVQ